MFGFLEICHKRCVRNVILFQRIFFRAYDMSKKISSGIQKRFVRPVCAIQVDYQAMFITDTLLLFSEHSDIRAAEAINGLAHVSNHEEAATIPCQSIDNVALARIGILVLVHHHHIQLFPPSLTDFGDG